MHNKTFLSKSNIETQMLGERFAKILNKGDIIILHGELGAGKSEFTRGIAKGLGIWDTITSPTFAVMNIYENDNTTLAHFDFYRINDPDELDTIGAYDYIYSDNISIIEWPKDYIDTNCDNIHNIYIDYDDEVNSRIIKIDSNNERLMYL